MPDYDRSKLARIVAFGLQMREQLSSIESRILSYAPSVSVQEMNRAILEGSQGYSAAQLVNEEKELAALRGAYGAGRPSAARNGCSRTT